jgi:hypothetical protein
VKKYKRKRVKRALDSRDAGVEGSFSENGDGQMAMADLVFQGPHLETGVRSESDAEIVVRAVIDIHFIADIEANAQGT